MKVTIDRFEGEFVVCEKPDRTMINVRILIIEGENIKIDAGTTAKRKKTVDDLMNNLWK
jgi:hypothetical protein